MPEGRYWLHTLGCPKNQVDSEKLAGLLAVEGFRAADRPHEADLVVVNTCAFIEAAREESVEAILALADERRPGARLVVTGCMAERYGRELADALPEVDLVAGFGQAFASPTSLMSPASPPAQAPSPASPPAQAPSPTSPPAQAPGDPVPVAVALGPSPRRPPRRPPGLPGRTLRRAPRRPPDHQPRRPALGPAARSFDLLELDRPSAAAPWAYVKVAEGCDRRCGFCAIPSFRGAQRSRTSADVLAEVAALAGDPAMPVKEVVLVAQDLASYGRDRTPSVASAGGGARSAGSGGRPTPLVALVGAVAAMVPRTRLLYLYPSGLTGELVDAVLATGVPYFDLSLQHVSRPLLARMRRWGDGERFLDRIAAIRRDAPDATFRSSFIVGYPGETEADHDALLEFLAEARLDWAGFFPFSKEEGTFAAGLGAQVPEGLALERLRECAEVQDAVTAGRRDSLVGEVREVLVDAPGRGRTVHEAPEIDGVVRVPETLPVGTMVDVMLTESLGTDLVGELAVGGLAVGGLPARGFPVGASHDLGVSR
jgi:ribosomal protein S12 methylthiotransferase